MTTNLPCKHYFDCHSPSSASPQQPPLSRQWKTKAEEIQTMIPESAFSTPRHRRKQRQRNTVRHSRSPKAWLQIMVTGRAGLGFTQPHHHRNQPHCGGGGVGRPEEATKARACTSRLSFPCVRASIAADREGIIRTQAARPPARRRGRAVRQRTSPGAGVVAGVADGVEKAASATATRTTTTAPTKKYVQKGALLSQIVKGTNMKGWY